MSLGRGSKFKMRQMRHCNGVSHPVSFSRLSRTALHFWHLCSAGSFLLPLALFLGFSGCHFFGRNYSHVIHNFVALEMFFRINESIPRLHVVPSLISLTDCDSTKLQKIVDGQTGKSLVEETDMNIRQYAKYLLKDGSVSDKRELLGNLRSRLNYKNKKITMIEE